MTTDSVPGWQQMCRPTQGYNGLSNRLPKISSVLGGVNKKVADCFSDAFLGGGSSSCWAGAGPAQLRFSMILGVFARFYDKFADGTERLASQVSQVPQAAWRALAVVVRTLFFLTGMRSGSIFR
jgi:hypothetical protein